MTPSYIIRPPKHTDRKAWEVLWDGYLVFYESAIPAKNTEVLWERILDDQHPIRALVVEREEDEQLIGLVHFYPHADTWEISPVCYLQDLFVAEDARLGGVGAALIQAVKDHADQQGWQFVYWQTEGTNQRARYLYDKLTGGTTGFITYQVGERTAKYLPPED